MLKPMKTTQMGPAFTIFFNQGGYADDIIKYYKNHKVQIIDCK